MKKTYFYLTLVFSLLLTACNNEEYYEDKLPATFLFNDNLAVRWNEKIPIEIDVMGNDVQKIELIYNDSIFKVWNNPSGTIRYDFHAGFYGLGAKNLQLVSTLKNQKKFTDARLVRVVSDIEPQIWGLEILKTLPHNDSSFTQGLEFNEGQLYEGTGQNGQSLVAQIQLNSGKQLKKMGLDATYFGEGITILGNQLFQLTWQGQKCFVYDKNSLVLQKELPYSGEGWGLCNDGKSLIMSDGSERLTFRNPKTFQIEKVIEVYSNLGPVIRLNELEYHDGLIYANVWMTDKIAVIDALNGKVVAQIDGSELVKLGKENGDVLNGIAYDKKTETWYMTGKNWPKLFAVKIKKEIV